MEVNLDLFQTSFCAIQTKVHTIRVIGNYHLHEWHFCQELNVYHLDRSHTTRFFDHNWFVCPTCCFFFHFFSSLLRSKDQFNKAQTHKLFLEITLVEILSGFQTSSIWISRVKFFGVLHKIRNQTSHRKKENSCRVELFLNAAQDTNINLNL